MNNQPTYVFKTSSVSVDIGKKLDRAGDHYLSSSYVHGNEKRVNNMTTLTLSIYRPLIRKQKILATLNCEGENKENAELFWRWWEEALGEKNESTCFNPTGIILDEKRAVIGRLWRIFMVKSCCSIVTHASSILNKVSIEGQKTPCSIMDRVLNFNLFVNKCLRVPTKLIFKGPFKSLKVFLKRSQGMEN